MASGCLPDYTAWSGEAKVFRVSFSDFDKRVESEPPKEMPTNFQSEWLTVAEAAQYLKIKPRTLLLWVRQSKVKAFALSGTRRRVWRFRQMDLDAVLLESPVLPSNSPSVRPAERMAE
jgi:excisionase family DNA binding protein